GIYAGENVGSDDLRLDGNEIYGNFNDGVVIETGNDRASITNNKIYGQVGSGGPAIFDTGLKVGSSNAVIRSNAIYGHYHDGIDVTGEGDEVDNNDVYNNGGTGIVASLSSPTPVTPIAIQT